MGKKIDLGNHRGRSYKNSVKRITVNSQSVHSVFKWKRRK